MGNTTTLSISVATDVNASPEAVWAVLTDPAKLGKIFWDCTVEGGFAVGSTLVWKGEWAGKPFEDRGRVLKSEPRKLLQVAHWTVSTASTPESNPNVLTWKLGKTSTGTRVTFLHENILTKEMKEHSEPMWRQLLERLKETVETAS
ncbi:MAG TPA: SRPBCC domain-containing protein [Spirochaetia bacterium]